MFLLLIRIRITNKNNLFKMLLFSQAVCLQNPCLSKEKARWLKQSYLWCCRQSSAQFAIKGCVARSNRAGSSHSWMQPRGTSLLTDPLHHLVSAEDRAVNKGWARCITISSPGLLVVGCEWAQGCAVVSEHRVTHYRAFDKGSIGGISMSQSARPVLERYGNIWDITSDWQLIPPWGSMRQ